MLLIDYLIVIVSILNILKNNMIQRLKGKEKKNLNLEEDLIYLVKKKLKKQPNI